MTETNNNAMTHLTNTSSEEIRDMFEQDIATIARQACDLRHPAVTVQLADLPSERQFYAVFGERLCDDDHKELISQMRHTWGDGSVWCKRIDTDTVYSVLLRVEK
jgi:hypothetical protein